jgi:hypothetical protein
MPKGMACCKTGLQNVNTNPSAYQGGMITRCPLENDIAMLDLSSRQLWLGFSGTNRSFIHLHHSVPKEQKKTIPPEQRRRTCWPPSAPSNSITTSPMNEFRFRSCLAHRGTLPTASWQLSRAISGPVVLTVVSSGKDALLLRSSYQ